MRKEILKEIEDILCDYYEAATDGHLCTEEIQKMMGNEDWADTILYRIMVTLFPDEVENKAFWDSDKNEEFNKKINTRPQWVKELIGEDNAQS